MKKEINVGIGTRISAKRNELSYSREVLAEKMGISPQFLAEIEHGNKGVSLTNLKKACEVLQVTADYLLTGIQGSDAAQLSYLLDGRSDAEKQFIEGLIKNSLQLMDRYHNE